MRDTIPCTIMRGGTSKGVFICEEDIPPTGKARDHFLLRLMGSPDPRQIDGLGGSISVTSKVAIIAHSKLEDVDIDYTFAQVSVDKALVSYAGNCGNISSAVGPYAIEMGYVKTSDPITQVTVYNTNTKKRIIEHVQTPGGKLTYKGDCVISGVPGTAAPVKMIFQQPAGAVSGQLLPTGNTVDVVNLPEIGEVELSIVDAANPLVFVEATAFGLTGTELPCDLVIMPYMLDRIERVRGAAAKLMGLTKNYLDAAWETPGIPKMTIISRPAEYKTSSGETINSNQVDIIGRMMSMQKPHPTYALTGAICTACASAVPGTIVHRLLKPGSTPENIRIGHPSGVIEAGADYLITDQGQVSIISAYGLRTARILLKGTAYLT